MTKTKPRGPTPSLIGGSNGRPRRASVVRKSSCQRCHAELLAGATCIEIPQLGGAYTNRRRICDACFQEIIKKTSDDLEEVKTI